MFDQVKAAAPKHPEWKDNAALKALVAKDLKALAALGQKSVLELIAYLRANGFKTFIVSGGTIEFIRVFSEPVYGIPPEQVVGSSQLIKFEMRDGKPVLVREPKLDFIDDGPGKPVGIYRNIGRRPGTRSLSGTGRSSA